MLFGVGNELLEWLGVEVAVRHQARAGENERDRGGDGPIGVELRGEWKALPWLTVSAASAHTRGTSTRNGVEEPLDSVEPPRTALGLRAVQGADFAQYWIVQPLILIASALLLWSAARLRHRRGATGPDAAGSSRAPMVASDRDATFHQPCPEPVDQAVSRGGVRRARAPGR